MKKSIQGLLLLEQLSDKYSELDKAKYLLKEINRYFALKENKLTHSKSNDEIYYFTEYLKNALNILKTI